MKDVLLNLANRLMLDFCRENGIDCSGTFVVKAGRGFRYNLVREDNPHKLTPYVSILFTKNSIPQFSMDDDAKAQRAKKIERLRTNMPGYILGDNTPYASDSEVLEMCMINDRHAEIHNMALEQSKRNK